MQSPQSCPHLPIHPTFVILSAIHCSPTLSLKYPILNCPCLVPTLLIYLSYPYLSLPQHYSLNLSNPYIMHHLSLILLIYLFIYIIPHLIIAIYLTDT